MALAYGYTFRTEAVALCLDHGAPVCPLSGVPWSSTARTQHVSRSGIAPAGVSCIMAAHTLQRLHIGTEDTQRRCPVMALAYSEPLNIEHETHTALCPWSSVMCTHSACELLHVGTEDVEHTTAAVCHGACVCVRISNGLHMGTEDTQRPCP